MREIAISLMATAILGLVGCGGTTKVSSQSVNLEPGEVFWAKNQLAEQTARPGEARFDSFEVLELSNGDRVYCGRMQAVSDSGISAGYVPFYMRRSGGAVKALNWSENSADFSAEKCEDARNGALRINKV
ncbi:hypothetical protein [Shimia marina]|uniref:Lipoprotein n=1 Tax=Shimia marina TaxID=321267 RepID=A0A0P1EPT3_9RHOB|nr:hypothetical protein [Shimia marina]CUH52413.1 hypothetical protein SHM7688_01859 [Shimia marina]SFE11133.1 hypothetical protein SAMN04488037_105182 [Shimia marina]